MDFSREPAIYVVYVLSVGSKKSVENIKIMCTLIKAWTFNQAIFLSLFSGEIWHAQTVSGLVPAPVPGHD